MSNKHIAMTTTERAILTPVVLSEQYSQSIEYYSVSNIHSAVSRTQCIKISNAKLLCVTEYKIYFQNYSII